MTDFVENNYPFTSAYDFLSYVRDPSALHLILAWTLAIGLVVRIVLTKGISISHKLLALYFGLTIFNNYAFQLFPSCSLGDIFGITCIVCFTINLLRNPVRTLNLRFNPARIFNLSPVGVSICIAGTLMTIHALCIGLLCPVLNTGSGYPDIEGSSIYLIRAAVLARIFVLGFCCLIFDKVFNSTDDIWWLVRQVVNFAVIGLIVYVTQTCMLLIGIAPYGLFLDAGYVGFPVFGSVSLERGHFGKLMTPLFSLFLLFAIKHKKVKTFLFFNLITLVNFSASSLSFYGLYVISSLYLFRSKLHKPKIATAAICIALTATTFFIYTWSLWSALIEKILRFAIEGEEKGGRGMSVFISYLIKYPLGISYGGSSLRTAPGLPEINSGLFAFITQESALSLVLIGGFLALLLRGWNSTKLIPDKDLCAAVQTGLLVMPFIFASDLLWFVPTIWLPLLLAFSMARPIVTGQRVYCS